MLAFDFVAAFADSTAPFYVTGVNDGAAELNDSPQQLTLRFSPGTVIDASTLGGISIARTGGVGDPFGDGGASADVAVTPGSITVGDAPNENEVVIRFAETLVDDVYRITIGDELRAVTGDVAHPTSFDIRLNLGAFVHSVVPQPIIREKAIEFTAVPGDGDLLEVSARGAALLFTFDSDPAAVDGVVDPASSALVIGTSDRTAADVASAVRGLLAPGGSPAAVFGGELASVGGADATISLAGVSFTPVVSFYRMINGQSIAFDEVPADGSLLDVSILGNGLQLTFDSDRNAVNGSVDPETGATVIATNRRTPRQVAVAVHRILAPLGVPSIAFRGAMAAVTLSDTTILITGRQATPQASFAGDAVLDEDELPVAAVVVTADEPYSIVPAGLVSVSDGSLTQLRDAVVVHFNAEDPLDEASAQNSANYQLFQVDPTTNVELPAVLPAVVSYNASSGTAVLTFSEGDLADGFLYRLQIGNAAGEVSAAIASTEVDDDNSSFGSATPLGPLAAAGGTVIGEINVRPMVPTPVGPLLYPSQPGAINELGHRDIPVNGNGEQHGDPVAGVGTATDIVEQLYNFQSVYGVDPQGNTLFNAITETQKQRAREVFEIYSRYTGIRFIETADQGITVVTGDMRALDPNISTAPSGLAAEGFMAIMDSTEDWGQSEYGGFWFRVALHEIGHALGLHHSYDIPSNMGAGLTGEAVFSGDYDLEHLLQLYPKTGSDIDVYSFTLATSGRLSAETVVARPGTVVTSTLDSVLTLYRENADGVREMIARNDDYFGRDSFLSLDLDATDDSGTPYVYFIAVTSTGNTAFNPAIENSGYGGRSDGGYELRLHLDPVREAATTIFDVSGRKLDGDRDGTAGGAFSFWFETAAESGTIYVDKAAATAGDGSLASPYTSVAAALTEARSLNFAAPGTKSIIRIVGNRGNASTADDELPYLIGKAPQGNPLTDGATFNVPKDVTVMIDADALFKLRGAVIDVGSSSPLPSVSRAGAALQVLGTPGHSVRFTSYHDDSQGGDSDGAGPDVAGGNWGGIVLREDSDLPSKQAFLNSIAHADIQYGGGQVLLNSQLQSFAPIHLQTTRPTLAFNRITKNAGAGISADPNSFEESNSRIGPELRGNVLDDNSINGLFIRIETAAGSSVSKLTVPARLKSPEIVYVIAENLIIEGGAGGYVLDSSGNVVARDSGRLRIDPGVVVKLSSARIELERGTSQLLVEGTAGNRAVLTSLADNRYGAGGTFDTNGILPDTYAPGDWGGIMLNVGAKASFDHAYVGFGGGTTPIEGSFDQFNVFEIHQGDFRLANSRVESNAGGLAVGNRTGRGTNADATIFVRGAQPVIVGNDFRDNAAALISINANSLNDALVADPGRSTGPIARFMEFDDNFGPLVRDNRISYYVSAPVLTPTRPTTPTFPSFPRASDLGTYEIQWNGVTAEAVVDSWVMRATPGASFELSAGWQARSLGEGMHNLVTPGASRTEVLAWAAAQGGVAYIEPNFVYDTAATYPNDPDFGQLWGLDNTGQLGGRPDADIDAPEAWDMTIGSRSVVIAVIDSGVDYTHPDLAANMWQNPGEIPGDGIDNDGNGFVDDVYGWDFADGDADPMDVDGHGTHVAGTIGAVGNNGIGITGVAWDVQIMALKGFTDAGPAAGLIEAVNYATMMRRDHGINVVATNNSWGGGGFSQALFDAIEAAGREGVLFVAAAGNFSRNNDLLPFYPASYDSDNIISVAATDRLNDLANFSHYGVTSVDIGAPGVDILSTLPGNAYGVQSGTSMAAPHVTGVAALLAAANPAASNREIRQAILSSAVPIPALAGRVSTGGLLNAAAALDSIQGSTGISGMVVRGEEITVESVWDDVDIVHVLRDEIIVNNFHTKTGVRLLSQSNASLVIKAQGSSAGFTAAGFPLEIDDRVGGTVQVIGQPGYPVVMTSFADDTIGVSLDALGRVVRDTNGDGTGSRPAAGDWRGLRFLPMSNDRNVSIIRESEVAYTAEFQANGTVDTAEVLGMLAPNYVQRNVLGFPNSWDSAQEVGGDDNRRLGFEVHGSISYDDPTDADVYSFSGYAGSEVWIDVDNTAPSLDAMVELLDADGNVLARSADSLLDTGVVSLDIASEGVGGQAVIDGVNQPATGTAAILNGVGAVVVGEREAVTGTAARSSGVAAIAAGETEAVTEGAAVASGIASRITATSTEQNVLGVAVVAVGFFSANTTVITVNDASAVQLGAAVSLGGLPTGEDVMDVDLTTNRIFLSGRIGSFVANGDLLSFDLPNPDVVSSRRIVVEDVSVLTGNERVNIDGVATGARIIGIDPDSNVIILDTAVNVTNTSVVEISTLATQVTIDTTRYDGLIDFDGLVVTVNGITPLDIDGDRIVVSGAINADVVTLSSEIEVADGDILGFDFPAPPVPTDTFRVDDTSGAVVGAQVTLNGIDTGETVVEILSATAVRLSGDLTITTDDVFGFVLSGTAVTTTRVRVADTAGIEPGVLVNGVAGLPSGLRLLAVDGDAGLSSGTLTFDRPVTVTGGELLAFGFASTSVTLDTTALDGQLAGSAITVNGLPQFDSLGDVITVAAIIGEKLSLSGDIDIANGDLIAFDFIGAAVATDLVRVDDASVATPGAVVTLNGVDTGLTVAEVLSGTVLRLSGSISLSDGDFLGFAFAGTPIATTRVRVSDVSGIGLNVMVNGVAGLPPDLRVVGVDIDHGLTSGTVTFNQTAALSGGDVLNFGFNSPQLSLSPSYDSLLAGADIEVNGVPTGLTVVAIFGGQLTLSDVLDVADGDLLGFSFTDTDTAIDADLFRVDDARAASVGGAVTLNGADTGVSVIEILSDTLVRLSGAVVASDGDVLGFDFAGVPVNTTRLRVADATSIIPGVLVNGVPGFPADLRVTAVDVDSGAITLDRPVNIAAGDVLGFGFVSDTVTIDDVTDIEVGFLVGGEGVPAGTTITNVNAETRELTFSGVIDVPDTETLFFGSRGLQLSERHILPGTLSGVVYEGNTAIQTFTVNRSGAFTFTSIGDPRSEAVPAGSTLDTNTGLVTLAFSVVPLDEIRIEVGYDFSRLSLATLGFQPDGTNGAYPLDKDGFRGSDMYSQNPRNPGMRVILPGVTGQLQEYFLRVRSQPRYDASTTAAEYEAGLTSFTFDRPGDAAAGATSGRYELRVRLRQLDEKPGSTVRYGELRYPTIGIDVIGLPRNTQLAGENGENPNDVNDTFGQAEQLGNLLATDRNTISVAGSMSGEGDIDWYTFTLDYQQIQSIGGVNSGGKTWSTLFDIDYADGFRGDLTMSVFDEQGRLIYVGRDSNVTDDQPGDRQGNDFDDLSRGSLGKLDPFIGSVHLPAGGPSSTTRYFVAISTNERLPSALDATYTATATNPLIRLEPISMLDRVVEDRIGTTGYVGFGLVGPQLIQPTSGSLIDMSSAITLQANVRPFTLSDVTLFVTTSNSLFTVDAFRGQRETDVAINAYTNGRVGDIDMRTDGRLFHYIGTFNDDANNGVLQELSSANGAVLSSAGDAVSNDPDDPTFWQITGSSVDALAIRRTDVATYDSDNFVSVVYSIRDNDGNSYLYWARSDGTADSRDNDPHGRRGQLSGGSTGVIGNVTGLQFQNDTGSLFGISQSGQFLAISFSGFGGLSTVVADFGSVLSTGETFEGLASAPVNLEGGRYQGNFFAITSRGRLVCIDPNTNTLVANVFDTIDVSTGLPGNDGYGDSVISLPTVSGATGLAFSPLDINLWHPTELRDSDAGHGQVQSPDLTRPTMIDGRFGGANNVSMYFGLETFRDAPGGYFDTRIGSTNQYGTVPNFGYNWQQDLTAAGAITAGGNNYDLPGGAYGSLITNPFSLAGYRSTDKPTLYFDYFLDTENASGKVNEMRDSARAFISVDDGLTWQLLATNNQARSDNSTENGELPHTLSTSSAIGLAGNQHVQELFDSTGSWRQARVDLGNWAGASSIRLRFDFSTAGELDRTDRSTFTPDAVLEVAASVANVDIVALASVEGLEVGMIVLSELDVDGLAIPAIPSGTVITSIDHASGEIVLSSNVNLSAGSILRFFRPTAELLNDIEGLANLTGDFSSPSRGANNRFEGFYIDNIIVGFAERGEMVTGAVADQTGFFDLQTPTGGNYFEQVLQGPYQLEIRRGTEYGIQPSVSGAEVVIVQTFDTNDRLVREAADTVVTLEENPLTEVDGAVVTSRGSGVASQVIDFFGNSTGLLLAGVTDTNSTIEHTAVMWHIDLDAQPSAFLEVDYAVGRTETLRPLPATFLLDAEHTLPNGDGVAVSIDGGTTWTTVGGFTATDGGSKRMQIDLVGGLNGLTLTADTVIGFFQSGSESPNVVNSFLGTVNRGGGIMISTAEVLTAPRIETSGLVGDRNLLREQGQFVIESNIISHAAQVGIRVDAGSRDAGSNAPHPGVARNLPTINHARLVPGAVIVNNIVASSGQAGIVFSGDANVGNVATAVVPYGRIINNTVYGGDTPGGIGVQVTENAAPTLLNNLFANLETGVDVDGSSQAGTVVGYSAYFSVTTPFSGVSETQGLTLDDDPFVDAATENFYLTELTPAIDSAIDVLQDRNDFVVVKNAIGLPPSPIMAPARDLYGQLRVDDPSVAGSASGIGLNVFKDRGAVDRVDFTQPTIALAVPLDNSPLDQEKVLPNTVRLEQSAARGRSRFVLQLDDIGVGIDKTTVDSAAFRITFSPYPGAPVSQRTVLTEGVDYLFRYLEASNQVVFESAAVYPLGTYRIDVTSRQASFFLPALLTDLAGSTLLPNTDDGTIGFTISLADKPSLPVVNGAADEGLVALAWSAAANGLAITGYEVQQSHAGGDWTNVPLASPVQTAVTVTGLIDGETYVYRVRAINALGASGWTTVGPFTPLQVPELALTNDTGYFPDDGITMDGRVEVSSLLDGAAWEYSINNGITWRTGTGTSFTLLPRAYAARTVQVRQVLDGATSSPGVNAIPFVVDVTAPAAPRITAANDDAGLINGIIRDGGITDDTTPTLYGTAEADGIVTLYDDADEIGEARVGVDGVFSYTPVNALANRAHAFAAIAHDLAGNASPQSPIFTVTIDNQAPEVSIDAVNDDVIPFTGRVENGGRSNDQTPRLTGRSTPFTTVIVKNGTKEVGRAVTDANGDWSLQTTTLAQGTYDFVATVNDALGRTGMSSVYRVTIDRTPPTAPVITAVTDNVGNVQGAVADGGTTDDATPTISGTAEPGVYVNIFVKLPDGSTSVQREVIANASGNWAFTPAALVDGRYEFKAIATDTAGNSSAFSAIRTLTIESGGSGITTPVTPGVLAITGVLDDVGSVQGDVPQGGTTDDPVLEILGTAPAAAVVEVYNGTNLMGSVVASANGTWSYTTRPLADGSHAFTAAVNGTTTAVRRVNVKIDPATLPIAASGFWGPEPPSGYRTIIIDFNQPVTGVTVDAFMIEHRGRKILVQGATVTGGGSNYVLKLPDRFRNLDGGFTITLFSTEIESLLNPGSRMRNPSYFTLPDPGMNNNPG